MASAEQYSGISLSLVIYKAMGWAALTMCCGYAALGKLLALDRTSHVVRLSGDAGGTTKSARRNTYMRNIKPFKETQQPADTDTVESKKEN